MYNEYHKLRSGANVCHSCRFLEGLFKLYKFKSMLDAGCGTAVMVRKLRKQGIDARGIEAASLPLEEYAKDLLANGTVFSAGRNEPHNLWTNGPMDQWTNGPMDQWTNGPMDQ